MKTLRFEQRARLRRQRVAHLAHHAQELAQHLPHDARPAQREVGALARIGGEVEELDAPLEARRATTLPIALTFRASPNSWRTTAAKNGDSSPAVFTLRTPEADGLPEQFFGGGKIWISQNPKN